MTDPLTLLIDRLATPVGELLIVADSNEKLRVIDWTDHEDRMLLLLRRHYGAGGFALKPARDPGGLTTAMRAYFKGDLGVIDRLPVATAGNTVSKGSVARPAQDQMRHDDQLCRARASHRTTQRRSRGGLGQRPEPRSASSCLATVSSARMAA